MLNCFSFRGLVLASAISTLLAVPGLAQPGPDGGGPNGGPPVYQWHPSDGHRRDDRRDWRDYRRDNRFAPQQVQSGWFQRPYPYHLDYYKMRYGGSYAPYFGNLYGTPFGTPQVVNYPPYYGPYYTGYGGGNGVGYGQPGNGSGPTGYPAYEGAVMPGSDDGDAEPPQMQSTTGAPRANGGGIL